jgi:hypothetical protein
MSRRKEERREAKHEKEKHRAAASLDGDRMFEETRNESGTARHTCGEANPKASGAEAGKAHRSARIMPVIGL